MALLNILGRLFASRKESALDSNKINSNNNSETTMITKEEMMQIASMVASMLKGNVTEPAKAEEPIVTELADADDKTEVALDSIDNVVDDAIEASVPTDQDSVMGGCDPLNSALDNIVADIASKVEPKVNAEVKDCATIVEYSEKGVAVYGDLKSKVRLAIIKGYQTISKTGKTMGAIFRRQLKSIEGMPCGWVIRKENLDAKGGINVLKASLEATGMTVTIGTSVKDITEANHAEWEAKKNEGKTDEPKAEPKTADVVPEAKAEEERIKAETKNENKGKKNKPSIAPTDKQRGGKKSAEPKAEETPVIPIVKQIEGTIYAGKSAKAFKFTRYKDYARVVSFTTPKGTLALALLCDKKCELQSGHFMPLGKAEDYDSNKALLDMLNEQGLAMALYNGLWKKEIKQNYVDAYREGGSTDVANYLQAKVAA